MTYTKEQLEAYISQKESQLKTTTSAWMKAEIRKGIAMAKAELQKIQVSKSILWMGRVVKALELDETGIWVTVRFLDEPKAYLARIDELEGFDPSSVPQVR